MVVVRCVRVCGVLRVWRLRSVERARWVCRVLLRSGAVAKLRVELPSGYVWLWLAGVGWRRYGG